MCDKEDCTLQEIIQHMAAKKPIILLQTVDETYPTP